MDPLPPVRTPMYTAPNRLYGTYVESYSSLRRHTSYSKYSSMLQYWNDVKSLVVKSLRTGTYIIWYSQFMTSFTNFVYCTQPQHLYGNHDDAKVSALVNDGCWQASFMYLITVPLTMMMIKTLSWFFFGEQWMSTCQFRVPECCWPMWDLLTLMITFWRNGLRSRLAQRMQQQSEITLDVWTGTYSTFGLGLVIHDHH